MSENKLKQHSPMERALCAAQSFAAKKRFNVEGLESCTDDIVILKVIMKVNNVLHKVGIKFTKSQNLISVKDMDYISLTHLVEVLK